MTKRKLSVMHVAVPFSMDTILLSYGKPNFTWGRVVASHSVLRALASSDRCASLSLLVPSNEDAATLNSTLLATFPKPVAVVAYQSVTEHFRNHPVDVIHMLDPNMWVGAHVRNFLLNQDVVLTGVTLSLANQHFLQFALENFANGVEEDDCLICVSNAARTVINCFRDRLKGCHVDFRFPSTKIIPLGVEVDAFRNEKPIRREDLDLVDDDLLVVSLSRFNPLFKMDLIPLLHLAKALQEQPGRKIRIVLAGAADDHSYTDYLQTIATSAGLNDVVRFKFDLDDQEKAGLLNAADVFVSLSDNVQESFGLTMIEALAAGCPIVASDWSGYRDIVEEGETGFLIPTMGMYGDTQWEAALSLMPDSIAHLFTAQTTAVDLKTAATVLIRLANDSRLLNRMSEKAAQAADKYDWQNVVSLYFDLWSELKSKRAAKKYKAETSQIRSSSIRFIEDFAGYPSSLLGRGVLFKTTDFGKRLLAGQEKVKPYGQLIEILNFDVMTYVLEACLVDCSVEQLALNLPPSLNFNEFQVAQNVMWLYKYGFLESV